VVAGIDTAETWIREVLESFEDSPADISRSLDELLAEAEFVIEPVTEHQARLARQAYADFGRGSGHRAGLNFGDCLSYALALDTREPLLWKGDDFGHTSIASALDP
jgi:ribonuclease VapC